MVTNASRSRRRPERAEPHIDPNLDEEAAESSPGRGASQAEARPSRQGPVMLLLLLMLVAAGAIFFYLWRQSVPPSPAGLPASTVTPSVTEAPPAIRYPIEAVQGASALADSKPLPALMVSDTTMQNALADLFGPSSLGKVFYEDAIIHRFVTTIDNLPRKAVPARNLPVKPVAGALITTGKGDTVAIDPENAARYTPYVQLADGIDAKNLVSAYVHFYPLMQQDYRDLGYPKAYFNDRVIEAIDDLLAAPETTEPQRLIQPKVLYQYADADVESRSAGQKIMIRMGSENAAKMKAKLREIRRELTGPNGTDAARK